MASSAQTSPLSGKVKMRLFFHDPDGTSATICTPDGGTTVRLWNAKDGYNFMGIVNPHTVAGDGVSLVEIIGCTDADGTSPTQIKTSGAVVRDAADEQQVIECTAEEFREVADGASLALTHIGVRITMSDATDEAQVAYVMAPCRFSYDDLTANGAPS